MRVLLLSILSLGLLSGCVKQIEDYVRSGASRVPGNLDSPSAPPLFGNQKGYKMSPGANVVAGSQIKSQFAITPTQRTVVGSQVKSKFSLRVTRTQ